MCCVRQRTGDSPDCWRLSGWLGLSPSAACRSIILPRQVSISCISKLKNNGIRVLHMSIVHSARMPQGVPSAIWRSHELRGWPVCRRQPASWTHRDWVDVTDLCRLCDLTMMMMSIVAGADLSLSRLQVTSHKPAIGCHYFLPGYRLSCRTSPPFGQYQIILLGDRSTLCEHVAQCCYMKVERREVERTLSCESSTLTITLLNMKWDLWNSCI